MIESVQFRNFKALRKTTLPLSRFTLIVGPNGSGKSTALQALRAVGDVRRLRVSEDAALDFHKMVTAGLELDDSATIEVDLRFERPFEGLTAQAIWRASGNVDLVLRPDDRPMGALIQMLGAIRIYSFDAGAMSVGTLLEPRMTLDPNGGNLAVVLDQLHNREPERFDQLNEEMARWLPEFDRILFDTRRALSDTSNRTFTGNAPSVGYPHSYLHSEPPIDRLPGGARSRHSSKIASRRP
ncbi:MAG: hypothetical protein DMF60_01235 [Acidobacteria bacterium]|nr:MAG: hypothetical protein DMF60_01235 [Acidobacteriota bacterium]